MSQPLPLVEQMKKLVLLQELDLKIDSLTKDKSSLPTNLKRIDDALLKLRSSLKAKKEQVADLEKGSRQAQAALDLNRDRITRANSKLEAVQNTHEFQAANKEIEQLKKLNGTLEAQEKKSQLDHETLAKEIASLEAEDVKVQADRNTQQEVLTGQEQKFKADIAALMTQRAVYATDVEARTLAQYNRVRAARGGLGISPAVSGRCKGCNMIVPPQLYNEIQRGSTLHACPSCHRLLFIPVATDSSQVAG